MREAEKVKITLTIFNSLVTKSKKHFFRFTSFCLYTPSKKKQEYSINQPIS